VTWGELAGAVGLFPEVVKKESAEPGNSEHIGDYRFLPLPWSTALMRRSMSQIKGPQSKE